MVGVDAGEVNGCIVASLSLVVVIAPVTSSIDVESDDNNKRGEGVGDNIDCCAKTLLGPPLILRRCCPVSPINGINLRLFDESVNLINFLLLTRSSGFLFFLSAPPSSSVESWTSAAGTRTGSSLLAFLLYANLIATDSELFLARDVSFCAPN